MFSLPRLSANFAIVDAAQRATGAFSRLWDQAMTKIEGQFLVSGSGIVVSDGTQTAMVRSLVAGTGLNISNGDGQSGNPTYSLANTAVTPGSYGDATHVAAVTVDQQGRLTACANTAITFPVTSVFGRTGVIAAATNDYSFSQISGTVGASQLPNPSSSTLGGVKSLAAVSHQFLTQIGTDGTPAQAQPAFSDISGTVAASQLPAPTTSALGGVKALLTVAHKFLTQIDATGLPALAQPASTDLSDVAITSWTPTDASGAGLTLASAAGHYIKIGSLIVAWYSVTYPSTADTNQATIGGLPATAGSSFGSNFPTAVFNNANGNSIMASVIRSTTHFVLSNANTAAAITNANVSGKFVNGLIIYSTA